MAQLSIYHRLNDRNAILSVFKDQVAILRPEDTLPAVSIYNLDGCSCLVALGTTPGSAVVFARISSMPIESAGDSYLGSLERIPSTLDHDEHYVSLVGRVVNTMTKDHELFQLPDICGIFKRHKGEILREHLRERTMKVFAHLDIGVRSFFYEVSHTDDLQQLPGESTII